MRPRRSPAALPFATLLAACILNREDGMPVHPIKETAVPTETSRAGGQPWPTLPIPFTAAGRPMSPVSPVLPVDVPPEALGTKRLAPVFTPPGPDVVLAPGMQGGTKPWHRAATGTVEGAI